MTDVVCNSGCNCTYESKFECDHKSIYFKGDREAQHRVTQMFTGNFNMCIMISAFVLTTSVAKEVIEFGQKAMNTV